MPYTYAGYFQDAFINARGNAQANIEVTVYNPGTVVKASLYTSRTKVTAAPNPFTTTALGNGSFYADPGEYDLLANGTTVRVFVPEDPEEDGGAAAHPDLATHDTLGLATQAELDAHAAAGDPHPGYTTTAEATALVTTHEAAANPHPTYTTGAEATALADSAVATHSADTTNVHGIADTGALATTAALSAHEADTTNVHGLADTSALATTAALSAHEADTTSVHGIADTANLMESGDAAGGVLAGTYPNPSFASDMATQAELDAHAATAHGVSATSARVTTDESTASVAFTDLTTAGPARTVTIGASGAALVFITADLYNSNAGHAARMGYAVSGATTVAAGTERSITTYSVSASASYGFSGIWLHTGLTPGSNTFTAKYCSPSGSGLAHFRFREVGVIPL